MALIKPLPTDPIYMMNHGVSLPDYFGGSAGITLHAGVGPETTIGEMLEGIQSDWNERDISYDCEHHEVNETDVEEFFNTWLADVRASNDMSVLIDSDLDNAECYQYFSIEFNS